MHASAAKIQPDKVVRWCQNGEFCVLHFQQAMCGSMVDIQSPTAEIRREKKKDRKTEITWQKYIGLPYYIGRP